ncbi:22324_t:CDS:2, partial [Racocetra persica]
ELLSEVDTSWLDILDCTCILSQPRFAITRDDKKNTQNEEQPLLCRLFKGDSLSHNNLAQYFVYRK